MINNMGLTWEDDNEFLITHLEGDATQEIKVLTPSEKMVLELIDKQFGDHLTPLQIISKFHSRRLQSRKVSEYFPSLLKLLDRAIQVDPFIAATKNSYYAITLSVVLRTILCTSC